MKRALLAGACAFTLFALADGATAAPYLAIFGGGTWNGDVTYEEPRVHDGIFFDLGNDPGFAGGVALGFLLGTAFRVEGEFSYRKSDVPTTQFEGLVSGDSDIFSFMANAWYDIDLGGRFTPYVGGGIGAAHVAYHLTNNDMSGDESADEVDDSDTVFAYQLGAGAAFAATETISLTIDYRFLGTGSIYVPMGDPSFGVTGPIASQSVMVGVRFNLSGLGGL